MRHVSAHDWIETAVGTDILSDAADLNSLRAMVRNNIQASSAPRGFQANAITKRGQTTVALPASLPDLSQAILDDECRHSLSVCSLDQP